MAIRVFISYSHDSPEHMDSVLALSNRLRAHGIDCIVDRYQQAPPEGWPRWTARQLDKAKFVIVVCSETYHRRFKGEESRGTGRGAKWEGAIMSQELYEAESSTRRFVPVLPPAGVSESIPVQLRGHQSFSPFADDGEIDQAGYDELYRLLTDQPAVTKPELGRIRPLQPLEAVEHFGKAEPDAGDLRSEGPEDSGKPPDDGRGGPAGGEDREPPVPSPEPAPPPTPDWRKWLVTAGLVVIALIVALVGYKAMTDRGPTSPKTPHFDYSFFKEMPYALFHSMAANEEELYWLELRIENHTDRFLSVRVTCQAYPDGSGQRWALCSGQDGFKPGKVASYTVEPGELSVKRLNPGLRLLVGDNFSQSKPLKIEWTAVYGRDTDGEGAAHEGGRRTEPTPPWQKTESINLVPKNRFYFQLADNQDREVDKSLLLASLAAWAERMEVGSQEAEAIADDADTLEGLVRRLYEELLQGEPGLSVTSSAPRFPPRPYVEIRPANALWAATPRKASPLEAALLVAALVHERATLFGQGVALVWPGEGSGAEASLFVAWRSGGAWLAVDLAATGTPYRQNLERARIQVSTLLGGDPAAALGSTGVYLKPDLSLAAVDLVQASRHFGIEGLP